MDIKQQTKNVAAQGRYGDSMLLHVNPAEVKGLASAMPITCLLYTSPSPRD